MAWIQSKVALSRCLKSVPSLGMCESVYRLKHTILHHFEHHNAAQENPRRCRKKHAKTNNGRKCAAMCAALAIYMTIHNWFVFNILQVITYQKVRWDHHVTCFWSLEALAYWFPESIYFKVRRRDSGRNKNKNKTPLCDSPTTAIQHLDHPPPPARMTPNRADQSYCTSFISHKTLSSANHVT